MDPSAACTTSRLQSFPSPTSQCPKVKRLLQLGGCLLPDFVSSTSNAVDGHTNDAMVFLLCVFLDTKTHGSKTDVSNPRPLAAARKQFLHSLVPSASPSTVFNSCTQTPRGSPGAIGRSVVLSAWWSPVSKACCTSPNYRLCT